MTRHLVPGTHALLLALAAPLLTAHPGPGDARGPGSAPDGPGDRSARLTLEVGQERHSFGSVLQGDLLEHTFVLSSSGEAPVEVRQAAPSCGCTVTAVMLEGPDGAPVEYELGSPIAPGRRVLVTAKLDTANKNKKAVVRINLYSNDPVGPTQLSLEADIQPFLRVTPAFVRLGDIAPGGARRSRIDIRTSGGEPVALELDPSNPLPVPPGMSLDLVPVRPDRDGRSAHWRATVSVGEGAAEGPIGHLLRLRSDRQMPDVQGEPRFYSASSSISGRVLGPVSITPRFLSLGLVRPGERKPSTFRLTAHEPGLDLAGVTVELRGEQGKPMTFSEHFTTSVRPVEGLAGVVDVEVVLEGLPEGTRAPLQGVLVIETGHGAAPELQVRLSGICRPDVVERPSGGAEGSR